MRDRRYWRRDVIAHADWSVDPHKRWAAIAYWCEDHYAIDSPRPAWRDAEFFDTLGPAVVGFDFPIGLPRAYAARAGITSFINALPYLSDTFYTIAERPEQISLQRPFYPRVPGGTSQGQLLAGLGLWSMRDLLRRCEAQCNAAPLFWTLGARQPGRAAIAGWRDLLGPALRRDAIRVWPFHGRVAELIEDSRTVVVEAYPGEAYGRLGIAQGFGKQDQAKRAVAGAMLIDWAEYAGVELSGALRDEIRDGFGEDASGEDRFDAVAGLLGMLELALGMAASPEPEDVSIRTIEGWIMGLRHDAHPTLRTAADTARNPAG